MSAVAASHPRSVPARVGRYDLLRPLGSGTLGTVYLARDPGVDAEVAVKLLGAGAASGALDRADVERIAERARAVARLGHEGIAGVLEVATDGPWPCIAMPRVYNGRTLARYCEADQRLRVDEIVRIVQACARALHFAHEHGVVHGEVKPRNILLDVGLEPRMVDFGFSAALGTRVARSPRYLSPEQVLGQTVGSTSDVFSLGVVLYELIVGRHPFSAPSDAELRERIARGRHVPLRKRRSDVPLELQTITNRCLAKRPANRYRTALHLAADLDVVSDLLAASASGAVRRKAHERARTLPYFSGLSERELDETLHHCTVHRFRAGDEIIAVGDEARCVYIVLEGELGVRRHEAFEIAHLGVGECVGEVGALTGVPRTATVIALDRCTLLSIPVSFLEDGPVACRLRVSRALLRVLAERLASALGSVC